MKANCPNNKSGGRPAGSIEQAAIMDRTVDFGCVEIDRNRRWETPKKVVRRPMPTVATLGDFVKTSTKQSVFAKVAALEREEQREADSRKVIPRDQKPVGKPEAPATMGHSRIQRGRKVAGGAESLIISKEQMTGGAAKDLIISKIQMKSSESKGHCGAKPFKAESTKSTERAEAVDSDDERWIENFEAMYTDIMRLPPKKSDKVPLAGRQPARRGTPRSAESQHCGGLRRELQVAEVVFPEGSELQAAETELPRYTKVTVALDSGAGAHVINKSAVPGHPVQPSALSEAGAAFLAADGGRIRNHGEVRLNLMAKDGSGQQHRISSTFAAADVSRALWSVGLICDSGLKVDFTSSKATVSDQGGKELCVFLRQNGLYVAEVEVENPGFQRRGT